MKHLLCILTAVMIPLYGALAQDISARQDQKARLEKEIILIEKQIREADTKNANALNKLTLVRSKVKARKALVLESEKELAAINASISAKVREIDRLKARLDTMEYYYARLVRNAYKNRDTRIWYMYLLSSGNLAQASRRFGYLRSLSAQMSAQARKIREAKASMEEDMENLKALRAEARKLMAEHQKALGVLKAEQTQDEKLVSQLKSQKSRYQKELAAKKRTVEALNREIEKLIKAQMGGAATASAAKKESKPIDYKLTGEFEQNKGNIPWPCEGTIVGRFGKRTHPVYKSLELPFNNGIDFGVLKGTSVKAVFKGEVRKIIAMPGYNKCVLVQHGSYFTFYCKLASVNVKAGDKINGGDVIGVVDTIDGQTQLHFQLWSGTNPQNPESWLRPL